MVFHQQQYRAPAEAAEPINVHVAVGCISEQFGHSIIIVDLGTCSNVLHPAHSIRICDKILMDIDVLFTGTISPVTRSG